MDARRRVVVTGATGNIGRRVVEALAADPRIDHVVGVARRRPEGAPPDVSWAGVDLTPRGPGAPSPDPLDEVLADVDVLVHLGWLIQPTRDPARLWDVNAGGSARLFAAAERAGVGSIVHASSVGVYTPAPTGSTVDECWPTHGIPTSNYGLAKAYVERLLDAVEARDRSRRVVRLRPALVLQRAAAAHVRRLFLGGLIPAPLLAAAPRTPLVPDVPGLVAQVVHAEDVAEAFRAAVVGDARGAFNLAAPPPLSGADIAEVLGARSVRVPRRAVRAAIRASWTVRLQPTDAGWFDLAYRSPVMSTDRATAELGWIPRWDARATVTDVLEGLAEGAGGGSPPLEPDADRSRLVELATAQQGGGEVW